MEMIPYFVPSMFSTLAISVGAVFALAIALEMADSLQRIRSRFGRIRLNPRYVRPYISRRLASALH